MHERWSQHAIDSLSWLQAATLRALGLDPKAWASARSREDPARVDEAIALEARIAGEEDVAKYREQYFARVEDARTPTEFESPAWFLQVEDYCRRIEDAARELAIEIPSRPLFGTLPLGDLNARAIKVRGAEEYLALFHVGTFNFLHALTKVVVQALPFHENAAGERIANAEPERVVEEIDRNPDVAIRFGELLNAYVIEGDPYYAPPYLLDEHRSVLAATIRTSSELFVVGHEYGHILDGHLGRGRTVAAAVGGEEVTDVHNLQADELEADARGLTLSIQAMRRYGWFLPQAVFGPALFLKSAELIGKVNTTLVTGSSEVEYSDDASHPPPLVRVGALSDAVRTDFPRCGIPEELVEASERWLLLPLVILDVLFDRIEPFWARMHAEGVRPHARAFSG